MADGKKNVVNQVYDSLMGMLLRGEYVPGDKLPSEHELKERYGASRNTVRTVLAKLNALGVVETRQGEGSFFKSLGTSMYLHEFVPSILTQSNDLMGLMVFRRGVEVSSARLAAINATAEDIASMEEYFGQLKGKEISHHEFAEETNSFHKKIAVASKNELLVRMLEMIGWIITSKMADFLTYKPDVTDSNYYHYMVFRCIKQHKPEEAAFMMDCHMKLLIDRVQDYTEYCKTKESVNGQGGQDDLAVSYTFKKREITP